jgi:hypothetical protein
MKWLRMVEVAALLFCGVIVFGLLLVPYRPIKIHAPPVPNSPSIRQVIINRNDYTPLNNQFKCLFQLLILTMRNYFAAQVFVALQDFAYAPSVFCVKQQWPRQNWKAEN